MKLIWKLNNWENGKTRNGSTFFFEVLRGGREEHKHKQSPLVFSEAYHLGGSKSLEGLTSGPWSMVYSFQMIHGMVSLF